MQGHSPYRYMDALNMSLFRLANEKDVNRSLEVGLAAGGVLSGRHPTPTEQIVS